MENNKSRSKLTQEAKIHILKSIPLTGLTFLSVNLPIPVVSISLFVLSTYQITRSFEKEWRAKRK